MKKSIVASLLALALAACGGSAQQDAGTGSVKVGVRSSAVVAANGFALRVYNRADFTGSAVDIWNWSSDRVFDANVAGDTKVLDTLPVGSYTFCAQVQGYDITCMKPVQVLKNQMAAVVIALQQTGNDGHVTIDSPFISGITLSDGAPSYGETITLTASVTGDMPLTYAWSLTCPGSTSVAFSAQAATTELTTDCKGAATVGLTVSNGQIYSSVSFPIVYSPQGAIVTVTLNDWPVLAGFHVAQAQLQPGASTFISIFASDHDPLSYAWTATCGTVDPAGNTVADGNINSFTAPATAGDCTVTVVVTDGNGGKSTASVILHVRNGLLSAVPYIEVCHNAQWGACQDVQTYPGASFSADASSLTFTKTVADTGSVLNFGPNARIAGAEGLVFTSAAMYVVGDAASLNSGSLRFLARFVDGTVCQIDSPIPSGNMRYFTPASATGNSFFLDGSLGGGVACGTKLAEPLAALVLIDDCGGGTGSITMSAITVNGTTVIP